MRTSDITLSIFIILVFVAMYFYNILALHGDVSRENLYESFVFLTYIFHNKNYF